jgi:hypothetical protein
VFHRGADVMTRDRGEGDWQDFRNEGGQRGFRTWRPKSCDVAFYFVVYVCMQFFFYNGPDFYTGPVLYI